MDNDQIIAGKPYMNVTLALYSQNIYYTNFLA